MDGNEDGIMNDSHDRTITIKSGLQTTLLLPELGPLIEECVRFVSELSVRGSRIVNGFLLHTHATGIDIDIDKPAWRQALIRQCFTAGLKRSMKKRVPVPGFEACGAWAAAAAGGRAARQRRAARSHSPLQQIT